MRNLQLTCSICKKEGGALLPDDIPLEDLTWTCACGARNTLSTAGAPRIHVGGCTDVPTDGADDE